MRIQEVKDNVHRPLTVHLTSVENTLRRLLLDVAAHIDALPVADNESHVTLPEELANQKTILRFTGGWVRDKLLGAPSHDIDVAVNKMTGEQFGRMLKEYLEIPGNAYKYRSEGVATCDEQTQKSGAPGRFKALGSLHKIKANPEKSKHLETVTTRILGLEIDLVNLRKESYTDDSRNPQIEFGNPKEDAMRRDATVNAMFYNIHTSEIEDFTGRGYEDMRNKIIRTPLEPYQTFKDDPLRVLRFVRLASRLDFNIDSEALSAMRDVRIKDALRRKISRERVGAELTKSLYGPHPHEALRLLFDLELYSTIFFDPTTIAKPYEPDTARWQIVIDSLEYVLSNDDTIASTLIRHREERFMAWQLAALVPYRDASQEQSSASNRKAHPPIAASVVREGIKATRNVCDIVTASVHNQTEISGLVDRLYEHKRRPDKIVEGENASARDVLGMAVRRWGSSWRNQVIYSFLVDVVDGISANDDAVIVVSRKYKTFLIQLQTLDLLEVDTFKPLIDGGALANALNIRTGPWMKDALRVVMAWQLRCPSATAPVEAFRAIQQSREDISRVLAQHFLKVTIQPLFQEARLSSTRRKVERTINSKRSGDLQAGTVKSRWKDAGNAHILDLLSWSVGTLDQQFVEHVWPFLIPPVLILLDDQETKYKSLGASLLHRILLVSSSSLLQRTGLGEVFEEALLPCLTYLPPLTLSRECVMLLKSGVPSSFTIGGGPLSVVLSSATRRRQYQRSIDLFHYA